MTDISTLIEFHYYAGGLKTKLFGVDNRPSWLPSYELVGLHNDVHPDDDDYVIEISRHKRNEKLISWLGVYTNRNDSVYGDRSNYAGVGVWIVNSIPTDSYKILDSLKAICAAIAKTTNIDEIDFNPVEYIEYIKPLLTDISKLPSTSSGMAFDSSQHPETLYLNTKNKSLKEIGDFISLNCVKSDSKTNSVARILFCQINSDARLSKIKSLQEFKFDSTIVKELVEYCHTSNISIKQENYQDKEKLSEALTSLESRNQEIEKLTQEKNNILRPEAVSEEKKTSKELLLQLQHSLSLLDLPNKDALINLVNELDDSRVLKITENTVDDNNHQGHKTHLIDMHLQTISSKLDSLSNKMSVMPLRTQPLVKPASDEGGDGLFSNFFFISILIMIGFTFLISVYLLYHSFNKTNLF
jgi:hypothetical protein